MFFFRAQWPCNIQRFYKDGWYGYTSGTIFIFYLIFCPVFYLSHRGSTESSMDGTWDEFSISGTAGLYAKKKHVIFQLQFKWTFMHCLTERNRKKKGEKEDMIGCWETAFVPIYFSFITHNIRIQAKRVRMAEDTLIKTTCLWRGIWQFFHYFLRKFYYFSCKLYK